jgi:hypothetical protein
MKGKIKDKRRPTYNLQSANFIPFSISELHFLSFIPIPFHPVPFGRFFVVLRLYLSRTRLDVQRFLP